MNIVRFQKFFRSSIELEYSQCITILMSLPCCTLTYFVAFSLSLLFLLLLGKIVQAKRQKHGFASMCSSHGLPHPCRRGSFVNSFFLNPRGRGLLIDNIILAVPINFIRYDHHLGHEIVLLLCIASIYELRKASLKWHMQLLSAALFVFDVKEWKLGDLFNWGPSLTVVRQCRSPL